MKSKFNFKSLSRAATVSLSLLAPAKSFAADMILFTDAAGNHHNINVVLADGQNMHIWENLELRREGNTMIFSGSSPAFQKFETIFQDFGIGFE